MKLLVWFSTIVLLLSGCTPEIPVSTEPQEQNAEKNWIVLSENSSLNIEEGITISQQITGDTGGKISFNEIINGVKIHGSLNIPQYAFPGILNFSILLSTETTIQDYFPSPYNFYKPLILNLEYEGLNVANLAPGKIDFYYMTPSGILQKVQYTELKIDLQKGSIKVTDAVLPHFSRYGFAK